MARGDAARLTQAQQAFEKALHADEAGEIAARATLGLGRCLLESGRFQEAAEQFKRSLLPFPIPLTPKLQAEARKGFVAAWRRFGDRSTAEQVFRELAGEEHVATMMRQLASPEPRVATPAPARTASVPAESPAAATSPDPAAMSGSAVSRHLAGKAQLRLAVLELSNKSIDLQLLAMIADEARGAAVAALPAQLSVISRESVAVVLAEMGTSECAEGECEVETARNLGADLVLTGDVALLQGKHVLTFKLHETVGGSLLGTRRIVADDPLGLLDEVGKAVHALLRE